jgi:hypothetical protein
MAEYRVSDEKDGIKVEMVVTVNSTVNVGFLITNNRGTDGYVYVKYYDDLGNSKDFQISYVRGDVNKSTGVLYSFSKPNKSFKACFDITKVEDLPTQYPQPVITEIWIHSPNWVCEAEICYDTGSDYPLWRNGKQEYVPVFPYKSGFAKILGWSRSSCYIYNWPALKVHVPPFGGAYQWAVVDVGSVAGYCPDEFTYLTVYPSGGDYWVTERRQRKYVDDFCFQNWSKTVSLDVKTEYSGYLPYTPFEVTLKNSGKILAFDMWIVGTGAGVDVYQNGTKIAQLGTGNYMATIRGNFKTGDVIKIVVTGGGKGWIKDIRLIDYWFNDVSDTMSFRVIYRTWTHKVDIKAYGVPEEFADEYVSWLRSRGVNAVKINPYGTASA